jgi:hypothetical protein
MKNKTTNQETTNDVIETLKSISQSKLIDYAIEHHESEIKKRLVNLQRKPIGFDELEFRFFDSEGRKYYGFPKNMPLPIERFGRMRDFMTWMTVGISPDEFEQLIDVADKSWVNTLKTNKNHQRVGLILQELKLRLQMVVHTDLVYNFLAVQWIREDENPQIFDANIQDAKVEMFKHDAATGDSYFFFHQPELRRLNELWNFTSDEWEKYWSESLRKQTWLKMALKNISSAIESSNAQTISNPE